VEKLVECHYDFIGDNYLKAIKNTKAIVRDSAFKMDYGIFMRLSDLILDTYHDNPYLSQDDKDV